MASLGYSQDAPTVSRADYNKLKAELKAEFDAQLKAQREEFKKELAQAKAEIAREQAVPQLVPNHTPLGAKEVFAPLLGTPVITSPGISRLTLTGGASATFTSQGPVNDASAIFNPIFLWEINKNLRAEGDVVFQSHWETTTELQTALISYDLCDYLTLGAGRFANPTDYFAMNLRKDWVNKLPNAPHRFLLPEFEDGVELSGSVPIGKTLLTYAAFVGDSKVSKDFGNRNPFSYPGSDWFNYSSYSLHDVKNTLEVGGRVGFEPIPGLELGYGVETFKEKGTIDGTYNWTTYEAVFEPWGTYYGPVYHSRADHYDVSVRPVLQTVDLNYFKDLNVLRGAIDFHAQWTWSNANRSELPELFQSTLAPFETNYNGGYAQLSYRPTHLQGFLANLEPVARYQYWESHSGHDDLWTFGLDYWLTDRTLLKAAYQYVAHPRSQMSDDSWLFQFATGF